MEGEGKEIEERQEDCGKNKWIYILQWLVIKKRWKEAEKWKEKVIRGKEARKESEGVGKEIQKGKKIVGRINGFISSSDWWLMRVCRRNYGRLIRFYICISSIQGDQLNMTVCLWYLVKSDLCSVRYHNRLHWTGVTCYKVPETHGHVQLVTLHLYFFHRQSKNIYGTTIDKVYFIYGNKSSWDYT